MIQYLEQLFVCDNLNVKESKPICEDVHEMMQCYGNITLQPITICMNILEDIHCGKIL